MSQQERKRSHLPNPEDIHTPVKRSKIEEMPAAEAGFKRDAGEGVEHASDLRKYDDDGLLILRPPPPITNWRFGVKEPSPPPELTEDEREIEVLWEEMEYLLNSNEDSDSDVSTEGSPSESTRDCDSERTSGASSSGSD